MRTVPLASPSATYRPAGCTARDVVTTTAAAAASAAASSLALATAGAAAIAFKQVALPLVVLVLLVLLLLVLVLLLPPSLWLSPRRSQSLPLESATSASSFMEPGRRRMATTVSFVGFFACPFFFSPLLPTFPLSLSPLLLLLLLLLLPSGAFSKGGASALVAAVLSSLRAFFAAGSGPRPC